MKVLNNFVEPFVNRALSQTTEEIEKKRCGGKVINFMDSLSQFTRDKATLRDQVVNTLLASRDTTAAALSWLFYELAYRPDIYTRLRSEVIDTVGIDGRPTYENLKNMKYMQCCLNEGIPFHVVCLQNNSASAIPDRSVQCTNGLGRYFSPSWWWSIWFGCISPKILLTLANCCSKTHACRLLSAIYATTHRPFWTHSK
jgi:Cytochrome P450